MIVAGPHSPVHLTYCTNIHPGESLAEVSDALARHVPRVRACLGRAAEAPFAVGLRLSGNAATDLREASARTQLRARCQADGLYVPTINGFPYGPFHGRAVKEAVYRPDWREPERRRYSADLFDVLAELAPRDDASGYVPSVSTVPGCFAADAAADPRARERMLSGLVGCAADLWRRREAGGPRMMLALEPEPACVLETTAQTVAFFAELFGATGVAAFVRECGTDIATAEAALRAHLGVCLDACHAAVQFEDPREVVAAYRDAGITIAKVQVTTGLDLVPGPDTLAALARYADAVYLHQTVVRTSAGLRAFVDLLPALAAGPIGDRWRVHFHVPVFQTDLAPFTNTQPFLVALLAEILRTDACRMFEVETYTWDVLPPAVRTDDVHEAIARELAWTMDRIRA